MAEGTSWNWVSSGKRQESQRATLGLLFLKEIRSMYAVDGPIVPPCRRCRTCVAPRILPMTRGPARKCRHPGAAPPGKPRDFRAHAHTGTRHWCGCEKHTVLDSWRLDCNFGLGVCHALYSDPRIFKDFPNTKNMATSLSPFRVVYKTTSDGLEIDADVHVPPTNVTSTKCPVRECYS